LLTDVVDLPLVLLTNVVLLAEVDEICDGLGGQQLQAVDNIDLKIVLVAVKKSAGAERSEIKMFSLGWGVTPAFEELG
jgi:hypothetical protein